MITTQRLATIVKKLASQIADLAYGRRGWVGDVLMYVYKRVFVILVHTCGVRGMCHLGAYMWGEGYMSSWCIQVG